MNKIVNYPTKIQQLTKQIILENVLKWFVKTFICIMKKWVYVVIFKIFIFLFL